MSTGAPMPAATPIAPQETPSALTRVLQTIYAPAKAFTGMNGKTAWIVPFLVVVVLSIAFVAVVDKKVGFDKVSENQMKMSPKATDRLEKLPEAQREKQMEMTAKITKYTSYAAPVFVMVWTLIIAAVLLGTFNFGFGANLGFGTSLSVVMLSWMPGSIKTVLTIVSLFAGVDPEGFSIQNPLATNLGVLFDPTASPFLYRVGSAIDIFMIWTLVVAGIGFSCVSKLKRSTAIGVIFGWYAVVTLVGAAIGALVS